VTPRIEQGFSSFEAWRDADLEEEERDKHKLDRKIADEEHWLRYGVTARRKRNVRRLSDLQTLRKQSRDHRRPVGQAVLTASEGEASGTLIAEARHVSKSYGERRIVHDLSLRVLRGDRLGIVGPNGAGKTTLINLLTGALAPDSGEMRLGTSLNMVHLDQARAVLEGSATVTEVLTGGSGDSVTVGGRSRHVIGYLKDFLFAPEQARTPVSVLSGGERNRLLLARLFAQPANLLVLDEPTNDLDIDSLELLEATLQAYTGTLLLVSHDRAFLDNIATQTLVAEGGGVWKEYVGGYSDWLAQRRTSGGEARPATMAKPAGAARRQAPTRIRLTFNEKRELEALPAELEALEHEQHALSERMCAPDYHRQDVDAIKADRRRAEEIERLLTVRFERWGELDAKAEAGRESASG
jgi:ATP-binding cassette subfamily F protein uup